MDWSLKLKRDADGSLPLHHIHGKAETAMQRENNEADLKRKADPSDR